MIDLGKLDPEKLKVFFNSFDLILSDLDGVLWNYIESIPQTADAVKSLRNIGKKVVFVTNNATRTKSYTREVLKTAGFDTEPDELITPREIMIDYLKKKNMENKKIFLIGMAPLRQALEEAGFILVEKVPTHLPDVILDLVQQSVPDDGTVGVVISDVDVNYNWHKILKAVVYLKRPEVEFLTGATDLEFSAGNKITLLGPGYFHQLIEKFSKRKGTIMAKNGTHMRDYIKKQFKEFDQKKILFMGDSVPEDVGFGKMLGCKTLLVLSGLSSRETVENWTYAEDLKPDFIVEHLGKLHDMIGQAFGTNTKT